MKIYKDKELTQEITILDFGIVEAGTFAKFVYYIYNETMAKILNLVFKIDSLEVKIITMPKQLLPKTIAELEIEWFPSITLKQGLKTKLNISGVEIWG